jgi:hypothetical protein
MSNSAGNVRVGLPKVTGGIYSGPTTATLPTDAATPVDLSLSPRGYVGDAGLTQSIGTDTSSITAWGGDEVRVVRTSHSLSYTFPFLETTVGVLREVFGEANVDDDGSLITARINAADLPARAFVFDMADDGVDIRIVVPNGKITAIGDVSYNGSDPVSYEVTVTAFPDDAGNKAYHYIEASAS